VATKKFLPAATISFQPLGFASLVLARVEKAAVAEMAAPSPFSFA
jgi:hypothetical protein